MRKFTLFSTPKNLASQLSTATGKTLILFGHSC
jgi:hypothetical protein